MGPDDLSESLWGMATSNNSQWPLWLLIVVFSALCLCKEVCFNRRSVYSPDVKAAGITVDTAHVRAGTALNWRQPRSLLPGEWAHSGPRGCQHPPLVLTAARYFNLSPEHTQITSTRRPTPSQYHSGHRISSSFILTIPKLKKVFCGEDLFGVSRMLTSAPDSGEAAASARLFISVFNVRCQMLLYCFLIIVSSFLKAVSLCS